MSKKRPVVLHISIDSVNITGDIAELNRNDENWSADRALEIIRRELEIAQEQHDNTDEKRGDWGLLATQLSSAQAAIEKAIELRRKIA